MYDQHPAYDVPQKNIVQRFFAQRWSAILAEIVLTLVITVAAGQAFDFFDPFDGEAAQATPAALDDAQEDFDDAARIALEPVTRIGMAHIKSRQFAAAEALFDLAIAVAPSDASHHSWRGYINLQTGDYDAARADFRRVLDLAGSDYDAHASLCWAYGESGEYEAAMAQCQLALNAAQSPPEVAIALENRCWLLVEMGEYEDAARDCLEVLAIHHGDCQREVCALAHYNLGRISWARGQAARTLRHFERAYQIGSAYPEMYLEIAQVCATLGHEAAARASYQEYLKLVVGGA